MLTGALSIDQRPHRPNTFDLKGVSESSIFYTKRFANLSLPPTCLFATRGMVRMLRGETSEVRSDPEEAIGEGVRTVGPS